MVRSSRLAHDGSTLLSSSMDPGASRAPLATIRCCRTASVSSGPGTRNARGNAERRSARRKHSRAGCNHAPRPGRRRRRSGTKAPSSATTRSRPSADDLVRHPTHVRIGAGRAVAAPKSRAGAECSAASPPSPPVWGWGLSIDVPLRQAPLSRPTPTRALPTSNAGRRRFGCRCATR